MASSGKLFVILIRASLLDLGSDSFCIPLFDTELLFYKQQKLSEHIHFFWENEIFHFMRFLCHLLRLLFHKVKKIETSPGNLKNSIFLIYIFPKKISKNFLTSFLDFSGY